MEGWDLLAAGDRSGAGLGLGRLEPRVALALVEKKALMVDTTGQGKTLRIAQLHGEGHIFSSTFVVTIGNSGHSGRPLSRAQHPGQSPLLTGVEGAELVIEHPAVEHSAERVKDKGRRHRPAKRGISAVPGVVVQYPIDILADTFGRGDKLYRP